MEKLLGKRVAGMVNSSRKSFTEELMTQYKGNREMTTPKMRMA